MEELNLGRSLNYIENRLICRCKECNIVFCRHENYVVHKKHYCQARETTVSNSSPPPGTPSPPLVQLICAACGIKFASMDNLVAHQAFYCPKRPEPQEHHSRCSKCKVSACCSIIYIRSVRELEISGREHEIFSGILKRIGIPERVGNKLK